MEMNIKFVWVADYSHKKSEGVVLYHAWVGDICVGHVKEIRGLPTFVRATFGSNNGVEDHTKEYSDGTDWVEGAMAWVEEQARAWLAEVTA